MKQALPNSQGYVTVFPIGTDTCCPGNSVKKAWLTLLLLIMPLFVFAQVDPPTVWTDKLDYLPGQTAYASGNGWPANTAITLTVHEEPVVHEDVITYVATDEFGNFNDVAVYHFDFTDQGGTFTLTATDDNGNTAVTTFTDAPPAADLDQIRNGAADAPIDPANWVNGNSGALNAHWVEGFSIGYRLVMENMPPATQVILRLKYDVKHGGKHAIDYLTHYQRIQPHDVFGHSEETFDPTLGVTGFTPESPPDHQLNIPTPPASTSPVPGQPTNSYNSLPASERLMSMWNGEIDGIGYPTEGDLNADNQSQEIIITFTTGGLIGDPIQTVILAWGGHIANRRDWGLDANGDPLSAGGLTGSPYHMATIDWDIPKNTLGAQDRSLKAGAVKFFPDCEILGPDAVCNNDANIFFENNTPVEQIPTNHYEWSIPETTNFTGATIIGTSDEKNTIVEVDPGTTSGTFVIQVEITDIPTGGVTICEKTVTVYGNPTAAFTANPVCDGEAVQFTNNSTAGNNPGDMTYLWAFGDGNTSTDQNPTHTYSTDGTYNVTLTVSQDDGLGTICTDQITQPVIVNPIPVCSIGGVTETCPGTTGLVYTGPAGMDSYLWTISGNGTIVGDPEASSVTVNAGTICEDFTLTLQISKDGCTNSCPYPVNVDDVILPSVSAPDDVSFFGCSTDDITVENADFIFSTSQQVVSYDDFIIATGASASDNCNIASITYQDVANGTCPIVVTRTWTVSDDCGNTATDNQTITINQDDFTAAVDDGKIVNCLVDAKVEPIPPTVYDFCGTEVIPTLVTTPADIACEGTMAWVFNYEDCAGNSHDWTYTYTIDIPDFTAAVDDGKIVNCLVDAKVEPIPPTVYDFCGTEVIPTLVTTPADIACEGTMAWVFNYEDCAGNSHDWTYTYTIDIPDFTAAVDDGKIVNCLVDAKVEPIPPTVYDFCGTEVIPTLVTTPADIACEGTMAWVFNYEDCAGNSHDWTYTYTIDIPDFTAAVDDGKIVNCLVDAKVEPIPPTVYDFCGTEVIPTLVTTPADIACEGTMAWVFNYEDCAGNSHDWTYTYTIDIPDFTAAVDDGKIVNCLVDAKVEPIPPTVYDFCGTEVIPTLVTTPADIACEGTMAWVFNYEDCAGNSHDWTYTYTIDIPDFTAAVDDGKIVNCLVDAKVEPIPPTVYDFCGTEVIPTLVTTPADIACEGTMAWVFNYEDCAGNSHDWTYTYTIDIPDFTAAVDDGKIVNCLVDAKVEPIPPTVYDFCGTEVIPTLVTTPADIACEGTMAWVFNYEDCAGNSHDWTYTYTIDIPDFTAAVDDGKIVNCLVDAKVEPIPPTVYDFCGTEVIPTLVTTPADIACEGTMAWVFNYEDCAGNSHDWTYTYTIDIPDFTAAVDDGKIVNCLVDAKVEPIPPTVYDFCGTEVIPTLVTTPADIACEGTMAWVFNYEDCAGNSHDWTYTYTIDIPDFTAAVDDGKIVNCLVDAKVEPIPPTVYDFCGTEVIPTLVTTPADIACEGTMAWVFNYEDCAGNSHDWTYTYTIDIPDFTAAVDDGKIVNCLVDAKVEPIPPTVYDFCGTEVIPTLVTTPADIACEGTMAWVFNYEDCAGNSHDWTYTYTIDIPDFTAAVDDGKIVNCLVDAKVEPIPPTVYDFCGTEVIPTLVTTPADIACEGTMAWVFNYEDCAGNSHDWTYTYTIDIPDFTAAVDDGKIVNCLVDAKVEPIPPTVYDFCGTEVIPTLVTTPADIACEGTMAWVFNYEDCAGNSHDWTYTYTIDIPDFTAAVDDGKIVNCLVDAKVEPIPPTVYDFCGTEVIPTLVTTPADIACEGTMAWVFNYEDCAGNSHDWTYTYTIDIPDFTAAVDDGKIVNCLVDAKVEPIPPTVYDFCGTEVIPTLVTTPADIACEGTMAWVFNYEDCAGNSHDWTYTYTIDIPDFTAAVDDGKIVNCLVDAKVEPIPPTVYDFCGTEVIPTLVTTPADIACEGTMAWVFNYEDCAGNSHDWTYTYTIDIPDFTAAVDDGKIVNCLVDAKVEPIPPTVYDFCGTEVIPTLVTTPADIACEGTMAWVFNYEDCAGNSHDWTYTYTIDIPDFTAAVDDGKIVNCLVDAKVEPIPPTVYDFCGTEVIPTLVTTPADIACEGTMAWVFNYEDCAGNSHDWTYTYTIDIPDFTAAVDDGSTVECVSDAKVKPTPPTVNDFCGNAITPVLKTTPADIACEGDMVWVFTYTDCAGNTHDWNYTYTVDDTQDPTISVPLTKELNCGDAIVFSIPTIEDNCTDFDDLTITVVDDFSGIDDCGNGSAVRTWTATDCAGNSSIATQTIKIDDCAYFELQKTTTGGVGTETWGFYIAEGTFDGTKVAGPVTTREGDVFGNVMLDPGTTYAVCETGIGPAWTSEWSWDLDGDGIPEEAITTEATYYPLVGSDGLGDNGTKCVDIGPLGIDIFYELTLDPLIYDGSPCTLVFGIHNDFPGGEAKTPGYWKNWNDCTNGGQDDVLGVYLNYPGYLIGDLPLGGDDCRNAVWVLDARDVLDKRNKKRSNDAAYTLARALLANLLNQTAGAYPCELAFEASIKAQALLDELDFNGSGQYLRPKDDDYQYALDLAEILDRYNNNHGLNQTSDPDYLNCSQSVDDYIIGNARVADGSATEGFETLEDPNARIMLNAYPNPYRDFANFEFSVPFDGKASLDIYTMEGRHVTNLYNDDVMKDVVYKAYLDAKSMPGAMYLYKLSTDNGIKYGTIIPISR